MFLPHSTRWSSPTPATGTTARRRRTCALPRDTIAPCGVEVVQKEAHHRGAEITEVSLCPSCLCGDALAGGTQALPQSTPEFPARSRVLARTRPEGRRPARDDVRRGRTSR